MMTHRLHTSRQDRVPYSKYQVSTVTVAGVTGALGTIVAKSLHQAGYVIQALTRTKRSCHDRPRLGCINIIEVDYRDHEELTAVLTGQDAVISVLGDTAGAVAAQEALIGASVAAGVKRFIPSEFGSDTFNGRVRSFPFFADKLHHQDLLQAKAEGYPDFSYSILITGPFLDWGMSVVPFIVNVGATTQVFDGGNVPFSTTRLPAVAKAIIGTLRNFNETRNRALYVHEAIINQNQLLAVAEELLPGLRVSRTAIDIRKLEAEAWVNYSGPKDDPLSWIFPFINISMWSAEQLCVFRETDNDLLGIEQLQDLELEAVIRDEVARALRVFSVTVPSVTADVKNCKAASDAFEEGRRKLVGFARSEEPQA